MPLNFRDSLLPLGWNEFFENQKLELKAQDWIPARVTGEERNHYRLQSGGPSFWGELAGHLRHSANDRLGLPATGDWVACTPRPGADRAVIHGVFQRHSCLTRKISGRMREEQVLAANVDFAFITIAANEEFNARRLERYLSLVRDGGATPIVLLTKADLVDIAPVMANVGTIAGDAAILSISTRVNQGIEKLAPYFKESRTSVLLGASGVGKSTLVNHLLGTEQLKTQSVREADGKGRHTTTARYLFQLPTGGLLIDTPGMRELGLFDHEEGIEAQFDDIEALAAQCRFGDCQHQSEPGCEVKRALESGTLTTERMASYTKLLGEVRKKSPRYSKKHRK